jgi:hypothetical protein
VSIKSTQSPLVVVGILSFLFSIHPSSTTISAGHLSWTDILHIPPNSHEIPSLISLSLSCVPTTIFCHFNLESQTSTTLPLKMSLDFARAALAERRPSFFLPLAPATSSSYPHPERRPSVTEGTVRPRRASISSPTGLRVLKLAPVYCGEHIGQNKDDFYDVPATPPSPDVAPSAFLSLAPTTSSSYPQMPASSPDALPESRRSSSSSTTGFRVLKLGPVYWGQHADDHKDDFHDVPASP